MMKQLRGAKQPALNGNFAPRRLDPIKILLGCCTAIAIIVAISAGLIVLSTYDNRVDEIRSQLEKLSSVLADHADRTFEALDLVELGVLAEITQGNELTPASFTGLMSDPSIYRRLHDRVAGLSEIDTLAILDDKGDLVNFSRYWPAPKTNASDRDYFKVVSQPNSPDVYISAPLQSLITKTWSIYFARRITSNTGDFLGVIVSSMRMVDLEKFYASIAVDRGDAITMLRTDGVLLARYPPPTEKVGRLAVDNATIANLINGRRFVRQVGLWDGLDKFVATTRSVRYPLLINASATAPAALMRWKRQTWILAAAAVLLEAGIFAVAIVGSRELQGRLRLSRERFEKGQMIAEAALALAREREAAAEEQSARDRRFRVAIETMRQGLCMFDSDDHLVIFNHHFAIHFGIPLDCLQPGLSLLSLIGLLEEHGAIDKDGAALFWQAWDLAPSRPDTKPFIGTLLDGRILSYAIRAMSQDKGWVFTCEDVTDQYRTRRRLRHISLHDPLTDLANRTALRDRIMTEAKEVPPLEATALLYLDLDGFKEVNDTLGHLAGDAVLRAVAERLVRSTRSTDTVARLGGDEFVVVQASSNHPATAASLAERLIAELRLPFDMSGHHIVLGASVGISFVQPGDFDPDLAIKNADLALYEAKKDGGNCYRIFEPRLETAANTRNKLCAELRDAVAKQQFVVYYQPLLNAQTRALCGFEALVRWQHPSRGLVPPFDFIKIAEEIGLISQIGEQVLFQACAEAVSWPSNINIAVNLSPMQFGQQRAITSIVQKALNWSGLDPGRLELEVTESTLLQGNEEIVQSLHSLKRLGVRIAMDDFGTGYSSLSYLQKFPFDKVKIDQSFVRNVANGGSGGPIISAILAMCKSIGLRTTAEGIENEQQFEQLAREGCDEVQGFLFGRPTEAATVPSVIARLSPMRRVKNQLMLIEPANAT